MNTLARGALLLLAAGACAKTPPPTPDAQLAQRDAREAAAVSSASAPHTTDAVIALGNLDVQIRSAEAIVHRNPDDIDATGNLIAFLLSRGQYKGRVADYEQAAAVADALVARHPESGAAHLSRASTLATFHRFADALAEAAIAERTGASMPAVVRARATTYMALGRFDEAAALDAWPDVKALDATDLATAAALAGERGRDAESEHLFELAGSAYRDVSPFPVAWVNFQRASLLERKGNTERAKDYFRVAQGVLPTFVHACVHLAALVAPEQARSMLEPLLATSDDPQVQAAYAETLGRLGRAGEAPAFVARARARYEELVTKHPEAFSDHAGSFYLGLGADPARALTLAKANAANRPNEAAIDLLLLAATATGAQEDACAAATLGTSLKYATAIFRATVAAAGRGCAGGLARTAP